MKKLLATVLFATFCAFSYSQKAPIEFGSIPMEDMLMEVYAPDSSASAVILADYGEAYVSVTQITATLVFERHVRIKILKNEGLKWANASIPLYYEGVREESVSKLKASTYNLENGKIVETEMQKGGVFKEKFNKYFNHLKFTLPNVKEGSVIEFSFNITSEFLSNFPNWGFQSKIPTRLSEYWAIIPDFFVMEKYMQGYIAPTNYEVVNKTRTWYTDVAHHWTLKNVPAFKPEPFMTNETDYISKINFALAHVNFQGRPSQEIMGSWEKLNRNLLQSESFGRIVSGSGFLKNTVEEILVGETDQLKKVEKIYTYVKENLAWDGNNDFLADRLKDVFEKKKGSSADVNLALASMLEKAGFLVDMVLVSTRDHGFVREQYPMTRQFNYVVCIVRIDGKPIFLDATEKYLPAGVLPERCLNGSGLIISKNFHGWIPLETKAKARTVTKADVTLSETGDLQGKLMVSREGYDANEMRKDYQIKGESEYTKDALEKKSSWQVTKTVFENVSDIKAPVTETHELTITEHATVSGNVMYINPFVTGNIEVNPFTLEERMYPVDYGSLKEKMYICKITLPEGYVVDELPKSKVFALPEAAAKYTYNVSTIGNVINILSSLQINRNIFVQNQYPYLREFFSMVVAKQSEQIVLKKK